VRCERCGQASTKFDLCLGLSLPLPEPAAAAAAAAAAAGAQGQQGGSQTGGSGSGADGGGASGRGLISAGAKGGTVDKGSVAEGASPQEQEGRPGGVSLEECVRAFCAEEALDEPGCAENSWLCARCKCHQPARKSLRPWRLPPVLLVHLKRFAGDETGRMRKAQTEVRAGGDWWDH
jgi:hypothetical protein